MSTTQNDRSVESLQGRMEVMQAQLDAVRAEAAQLCVDLGNQIATKIMELYGRRQYRQQSFEQWLSDKFDNGFGREDLFDEDPDLKWMRLAAGEANMLRLATDPDTSNVVNQRFRDAGHEFGLYGNLARVLPLTGKRLGLEWHGNHPTD